MNLVDLRTLLDYHYWARDRMLDAIAALTAEQFTRDLGSSFKSVRDTVVHLYGAESSWYSRWQGISPTALLPPDQFSDCESLRAQWSEHEVKMRAFLENLGESDVTQVIEFKLLNGQPAALIFGHMLQHVVNHASYHRGQVTTMLRQLGASPPKSMDMIAFYRKRSGTIR
jgi:uncharacterized damage-inducible protein DinB